HQMSRYETPWALHTRRIHAVWWAPALPACGDTAFDFLVSEQSVAKPRALQTGPIENEHLTVSATRDGTFEVVDRKTGAVYRRVAAFEDAGDVGDEYTYCPPIIDRRLTNADARATSVGRVVQGPLRSTLRTEFELPVPRAAAADRSARAPETVPVRVTIEATLDKAAPRVAFTVVVDNRASDHRLRLIFPTGSSRVATARADTAFDVVTRPARQRVPDTITNEAPVSSAPMISVVDAGDSVGGATVIAKGLMEYEILEDEKSIALTLIRAVGDLSRNDLTTRPSGHAGPPVVTPGAQCLGVHRFEVAFQPRGCPPSASSLIASARAHNLPPSLVSIRARSGGGPPTRSFVHVDWITGGAVLSALKQAEDRASVIVRLFNPDDDEARGAIRVDMPVERAYAVNLLEERQSEWQIDGGAIPIVVG